MLHTIRIAALGGVLALTAACSGGGSDGQNPQMGQLTLSITDTPVEEAARVVVVFTGVEVKASEDGAPRIFEFDAPRQIDLLVYADGSSEVLLDQVALEAGEYEWIRLLVNAGPGATVSCDDADTDSFIELDDGGCFPLFIPSGSETGLKLVHGFTIAAGGHADYTIDFDLRRSVLRPPGLDPMFLLKPALRLVNNVEVGSIEGEVAAAIAAENCSAVVYVYEGAGIVADDLGSPTEPLVTAPVVMDDDTGQFRYRANFLLAGDYTAALTCQADLDDAEQDDAVEFLDPQDATVVAGEATVVDFSG